MPSEPRLYLSDLPDAGELPPDRWRLPDRVEVPPIRDATGAVVDGVVMPVYSAAASARRRGEPGGEKWVDAARARGAMAALAGLAAGELADVEQFVRKFGALNVDRDTGLPRSTSEYPAGDLPGAPSSGSSAFELASDYIRLARALDRALEILDAIRRGSVDPGRLNDLHERLKELPDTNGTLLAARFSRSANFDGAADSAAQRRQRGRFLVASFVNWWMTAGHMTPLVRWRTQRIANVLWNGGLWGAVGSQLLITVAEERQFSTAASPRRVRCAYCGKRIPRQRIKANPCCDAKKCQARRVAESRAARRKPA